MTPSNKDRPSGTLRCRESVLAAGSYTPTWSTEDRSGFLRLDRNESTAPLSDTVAVAIREYVESYGVFAYPEDLPVTESVARYCETSKERVLLTNGSDQGIDVALRGFVGEGDRLLVARPEFAMFEQVASVLGTSIDGVPYLDDLTFPYAEFDAALTSTRPDLIVFINPNNPTGTPVDTDYIVKVAAAHPDLPVLVDEAYYEFTGTTVADQIAELGNIIVIRSFSKAFAMAGLRIGCLLAQPDLIEQFRKIRGPFDVNSLALVALQAQLGALDEVRSYVDTVMHRTKPMVVDWLGEAGVPHRAGAANFVLVKPPAVDAAIDHLRQHKILVRPMLAPQLQGWIRVSMGSEQEMEQFIDVFGRHLQDGATR